MKLNIDALLKFVLPSRKTKKGGIGQTATFDPQADGGVLTAPRYRDHTEDLFDLRQTDTSLKLMKRLFVHDPDVSAALNAYLTVADTPMRILVRDIQGNIDRQGMVSLDQLIRSLTSITDYSEGFQLKPSLAEICAEMRYMVLLRGGISAELVLNDKAGPSEIRNVDLASILWIEKTAGLYKPQQAVKGGGNDINLDIPTFFVAFYRRDPTEIYTTSTFVSSINTISARQQVINDLYRIMNITGYPRITLEVIEEVIKKNAPSSVQQDPVELRKWINARLVEIQATFNNMRPDQAFIHTDSVKPSMLNDRNPASGLQIKEIIDTLNAQNQAGLKVVASFLGRGEAGVNTASVEARVFSMNADSINKPIESILSKMFSFMLQLNGLELFADVTFAKSELRPETELEPQLIVKSTRLKQDLSLGLITDDEYHIAVYQRPRPDSAPELSGTGFMDKSSNAMVDVNNISPNADPLGRSISPDNNKAAKSNNIKTGS